MCTQIGKIFERNVLIYCIITIQMTMTRTWRTFDWFVSKTFNFFFNNNFATKLCGQIWLNYWVHKYFINKQCIIYDKINSEHLSIQYTQGTKEKLCYYLLFNTHRIKCTTKQMYSIWMNNIFSLYFKSRFMNLLMKQRLCIQSFCFNTDKN